MIDLKPGQSITCTITKVPPTEDGRQTLMRLMRKDPATIRALRRGQRRRRQNMLVYNRGNRDWTSRQTCGKIVRCEKGEAWSMTYTADLAREFAIVAPFVSVK
jgi:hypothetical protein